MNGSQQFHINQMTRRDAMSAAQSHRIARIATQNRPTPTRARQTSNAVIHPAGSRLLRITVVIIALTATLLVFASPSYAQDVGIVLTDFGASEAYHESYVIFRVAYYHQIKGEHERAVAEFTEAVEGLPTFVEGYAARGDSYYALGDFESAIADYTTAVEMDPGFVSVLYNRGRAYNVIGLDNLAVADFENAIQQMPQYPLPYLGMGDLHYAAGSTAMALSFYRAYVELSPETPDMYVVARMGELQTVLAVDSL